MPPLGQNTAEDFLQGTFEPIEADPRIAQCKEKGGTWNTETLQCDFTLRQQVEQNTAVKEAEAIKETEPTGPTLLTDEEKATATGPIVTDAEGNERIDTPADRAAVGGVGAAEALQQQQTQAAEQQRMQQILSGLGQVGVLTTAQQAEVNKSQAALAGGVGTLAGAATGVIGGALIGGKVGAIGGVAGVAIGVGLGAIGGFITGYISNVKKQQTGEIGAAELELTSARKIMRGMAEIARQDPARAQEYKNIYNRQLTRVSQARRQLKAEVTGDLNSWMEDGRDNLARFDLFLAEEAPFYAQKLEIALLTGGEGISFTDEQLDEMFGVTGEEI